MSCPDIQTCPVPITKDFFKRVCNTGNYSICSHYAKRHGFLKPPIEWLQKIAVEKAPRPTQLDSYPEEVEMR